MTLITKTDDLIVLCKKLRKCSYITLDTEFIRDKYFYPKLCLIQVGYDGGEAAIDPLSDDIDLKEFYKILSNKKILKVLHSCKQDIEIFYNHTQKIPHPIFDTQVAAMVCGYGASVGYFRIVEDITNAKIDKKQRFTDWAKRPLTNEQIEYAISDVTHLRDVYKNLKDQLKESGRESWLREEVEDLSKEENYQNQYLQNWRKIAPRSNSRTFLGIIKELVFYREKEAARLNIPRPHLLKDQAIIELAALMPTSTQNIYKIRSMHSIKNDVKKAIVEIVEKVKNLDEKKLPEITTYPASHKNKDQALLELLKVLLKAKSEKHGVAQKVIATTDDLEEFIASIKPDKKQHIMYGWRYEVFGKDALKLKQGEIALTVKNGLVEIVNI